ncbi:hypothetical protein FISHEDRAFT_63582 [Fistulina hepatica ATCC 64428]|uniref:EF-hand domain-containing protein n=1 Tax=Fistulina hepatica ATCC 64428 TaxID=1128425 RepID=A0A0D7AQ57_9AGAR|nr:hypothetical protein FISHEDRAFT_63582 [Fistulina hepatica ATCC 64428]
MGPDGKKHRIRGAKRGRAIYLAFMKLSRAFRIILVGVLGAGILITPFLVVELHFPNNVVRSQVHFWSLWLSIAWVAGCVSPLWSWMLLLCFLVFTSSLMSAVSGWLKLALDVAWTWIALSVVRGIEKPVGDYQYIFNHVMQALFASSIIIFVEKLFLHYVASNFHERALADRLAENRLGLKALDRLSTATFIKRGVKGNDNRGHKVEEKKRRRGRNKNRAFASVIVDQLGTAVTQVALKDSKLHQGAKIGGQHSARKLARKLFQALAHDGYADADENATGAQDPNYAKAHVLTVEDFYPYFRTTTEAQAASDLFDKDGNGDLTKREVREGVQRIYKERKALADSLKDVGAAIAKLDGVLIGLALVMIVCIYLLLFNPTDTLSSLVPMASIVLGSSFAFGSSAATLFNSLIFIFSTHVFDVGDVVYIDDQICSIALTVREFGLFSTTFRRVGGQEIIAPNSMLSGSKLIHNFRRSGSMWETTNLQIAYSIPISTIEKIKSEIKAWVNENSRDFSSCDLNIDKMEYQNAMTLIVSMEHRANWQDSGARWTRRTKFMRNLKLILEKLDVKYTLSIQPVLMPRGTQTHMPRFPPPWHSGPNPYVQGPEQLGNAGIFRDDNLRVSTFP